MKRRKLVLEKRDEKGKEGQSIKVGGEGRERDNEG